MSMVFISATGTDIGKTFVTSLLLKAALKADMNCTALKPVISGFSTEEMEISDSGQLLMAQGKPVSEAAIAEISPWRFAPPLSPDMAAARAGVELATAEIVDFCLQKNTADSLTFIEGVGGVMVPLNNHATTLDWQAALHDKGCASLLVAGTYLGTMSHTLTALAALAQRGIAPAALILNTSPENPVPATETAAALSRYIGDLPVFIIPRDAEAVPDGLTRLLGKHHGTHTDK
jgi:dethiobiotin synthetase